MKYPFEQQSDLKDCGVSCLLMLIRYYGGGISKEYLRNLTHTTKDGVTAYSLIEGAKQLGFSACGVSGVLSSIKKDYLPCIAHVVIKKSYQHFIVIYDIFPDKKKLLIADPAKRKLEKITFEEFNNISTNKFILLKPKKKIEYISKNTVLKDLIYKFINDNNFQIFLVFCISLILTFLNILNSFQFKFLMEYAINYNNLNNLVFLALVFVLIVLLKEFSNYYRNSLVNVLNLKLDKTLFSNIYHHILSLPYLYYKNRTTGEIVARINDLESIREVISKLLVTVLLDIILMITSFITLLLLSSSLTIILIIMVLLFLIVILIFKKPLEDNIINSKKDGANLNSFLVETIGGIETIQNCDIQNYIENNFTLKYGKYHKNIYSYHSIFIKEQFLKDLINNCGTLLTMIMGCVLVIEGKIDIALLITYITLISYFLNPIQNIIDLHLSWKEAKTSLDRIKELYEIEEIKNEANPVKKIKELFNNIKISNLKYSYNGHTNLLNNLNLSINNGDKVLIHGSSGSGKSTLSKLLSKQLAVNNKMIFYNERDINNYSISDIKKNICYVSQQETLFTDSVYQNVVLDKNISYDEFLKVMKICQVDEFIENDILKYDMLLEENGFNLSGGQRQRIILARSLIRNASIYILDEALNEIDIEKERQILESIFKYYPDKIFIVISHRFHNQDLFNKRYLIDNGVSYEE